MKDKEKANHQDEVIQDESVEQGVTMKERLIETAVSLGVSCLSAVCTGFFLGAGNHAYGKLVRKS